MISPPRQPVSAKAVIVRGNSVLLLHQRDGRWDLPGGNVDPGEHITEGLLREVLEETGLIVGPKKLLTTRIRSDSSKGDQLYLSYLCKPEGKFKKKRVRLSSEHQDFELYDIRKIDRLDMPGRHKEAIRAAHKYLREQQSGKSKN